MTNEPTRNSPIDQDDRRLDDSTLDETIRRALEPPAHVVDRVTRRALAPTATREASRSATPAGRRWAVGALALAATVVLASLMAIPTPDPNPVPEAVSPVDSTPAGGDDAAAILTISNASGVLTVSTAAGARWILLPGDSP